MFPENLWTSTSPTFSRLPALCTGSLPRTTVVHQSHTTSWRDRTSVLRVRNSLKQCDKSYDSNLIITGGWGTVSEIPSSDPTTFKCQDLSPKKEYKFRVKAVNKMGPSEPATFNKTILAKDPWGKHNYIVLFFNR